MSRFPTAGHRVSWAELCPRTIQSGAKSAAGRQDRQRECHLVQLANTVTDRAVGWPYSVFAGGANAQATD